MRIPFLERAPVSPYPKGRAQELEVVAALSVAEAIADRETSIGSIDFTRLKGAVVTFDCSNYLPYLGQITRGSDGDWETYAYIHISGWDKSFKVDCDYGNGKKLTDKLFNAARYMHGNETEIDFTGMEHFKLSTNYWNSYWRGLEKHASGRYEKQIHPIVIDCISKIASLRTDRLVIADIFGGNGQFLKALSSHQDMDQHEFHLVDGNSQALKQARSQFDGTKNVFIYDPTDLTKDEDIVPGSDKLDIVTALGGVCSEVIHREEALGITTKVFGRLNPGGFFIATGYSNMWLNSVDFQKIGFKVLNKVVPKNIYTNRLPQQFYVVQKPKV